MAFEFLNDVPWDSLNAAGTLAGRLGGIYNMFRPQNATRSVPFLQDMLNNAASAREYLNASVNPQHPFFQNLQAIYNQQMREQAANAVKQMFTEAARRQASGSTAAIINPERRDSNMAQALARAFMEARMKSQEMARTSLENAAGGFSKLNYLNGQIAPFQQAYSGANLANRMQGFQGISSLFSGINFPRAKSTSTAPPADDWSDAGSRLYSIFQQPQDLTQY